MEELFSIKEVAILLKLSTSTIYRYVESGIMKYNKIGRQIRFTNEQIQDFLLRQNVKGVKNE